MQCSNRRKAKKFGVPHWCFGTGLRCVHGVFAGTAPAFVRWRCAHYDGIVALAACEHFGRSRGVSSMVVGMLVAGIGLVVAGLLAIGFGIPVKEFSFGNTLILTGVIGVCTGAIMVGLWMAVRELQNIARRLGGGVALPRGEVAVRPVLPPGLSREPVSGDHQEAAENAGGVEPAAPAAPPWLDEA